MNTTPILKVANYAIALHNKRNLIYNGKPYSYHLSRVYKIAELSLDSTRIAPNDIPILLQACWLHDTLEDCAISYNDLKQEFGEEVADVVYNVTNELGKNRKERNEKTYPKIARDWRAVFVKLCDRIANQTEGGAMNKKYQKEYIDFRNALYNPTHHLDALWQELDKINEVDDIYYLGA